MKKIVKEHINEKFTEDSDPIKDMKIGIGKILIHYAYSDWPSLSSHEYATGRAAMKEAIENVDENCRVQIKQSSEEYGEGTIIISKASLTIEKYFEALENWTSYFNDWKITDSYEFEKE